MNDGLKGDLLYSTTLESAVLILKGWKPTGIEQPNLDNTAAAKKKEGVGCVQEGQPSETRENITDTVARGIS